ncbi:23S rRNA (uracil(1939)-C(5))-methyltransferase RlmD [Culicoidibacter larvae]|uniref:23S rRNA (Uracil(1939)-C(5))-methyltransferase RlmD n=1 Tax=Culicoidibacter larvae TaxID=2579976 RepID=A0A5R8QFB5_9FIRM|nr:23S rRNA (uracil(1939)-C(5))-methyltransferase RlmD [Culicoidibacter larvae]TLG75349.1 23S rRNA (uracil(1939)-C(5))-methyltransferase RlmD [Culicoidibacter larvae]
MLEKDILLKNVECVDYSHEGMGVVKHEGMAIFVPQLLMGEVADIVITKVAKRFAYGQIVKLVKVSSERAEVDTESLDESGVCQLQHMKYDEQLRFKELITVAALKKHMVEPPVVMPVIESPKEWHYRNKMQVPVRASGPEGTLVAGFFKEKSHDIVPFAGSTIHDETSSAMVEYFVEIANQMKISAYDSKRRTGNFRHLIVQHAEATGEYMLVFVTFGKERKTLVRLAEAMVQKFPQIKSVVENVNTAHNSKILGESRRAFFGEMYITDAINDGLQVRLYPESFYQVNHAQMEQLYQKARDLAEVKADDVVADFYSGIGTMSMLFAQNAKFVYGVEVAAQAVKSADLNAELNSIHNVEFIENNVDSQIEAWVESGLAVDVALIDPPRKGCSREFIENLVRLAPKRIVYISCHPDSFARDLNIFAELGYTSDTVFPFDMFPQTYHVETVVLMSRVDK